MRGNPVKILNAMDDFAREQDFLISIGPHKAGVLGEFIAAEKPRVAAEFGGYVGYSAIWFAEQMRKAAGADASQLRVWSLEFDPLFAAISMSFIELAGLSDIAKVIVGKADESLTRLTKEDKVDHIDFLFLDHDESLYMQGLKAVEALGLLKPGMVIAADNAVRPGAPDYVKYVRAHPKLDSKGVRGLIVPGDREVRNTKSLVLEVPIADVVTG